MRIDHSILRDGDVVHVRATVEDNTGDGRALSLYFGPWVVAEFFASGFEIIEIERPQLKVGDRVIADGHPGIVLCVWPDGELLWVRPDGGNRRPWTVAVSKCRREPTPPASAEIIDGPGRLVPRNAEAAE